MGLKLGQKAKSCKKIFVVQKSNYFLMVTSFFGIVFAKSAVKMKKSNLFIFYAKFGQNDFIMTS